MNDREAELWKQEMREEEEAVCECGRPLSLESERRDGWCKPCMNRQLRAAGLEYVGDYDEEE